MPPTEAAAERSLDPRVERTRAAVVDATLDLLTEGGFASLSIDAIARRSGVARTTIYRHWPSVSHIVHEAATCTMPSYDLPDTGDARADLRAHVQALAAKLTSSDWGRLLPVMVDAAGRDREILELQREATRLRRTAALGIVRAAAERGVVRSDVDVELVGEMLVGPLFTRRLVTHQPITEAFVDQLFDVVWELLTTPHPPG